MGSDPLYAKYPDLTLAQDIFNLANPACTQTVRQGSLKKLQDAITEHHMAPLYRHLAHPVDGILNTTGEGATQHTNTAAAGSASTPTVTSNLLPNRRASVKLDFPWDEKLYDSLVAENNKELASFQKEEDEAGEAAGETEVHAARGKRAEFWARVGDKVNIRFHI
jgi:26S proteasome regulatory subunit N7